MRKIKVLFMSFLLVQTILVDSGYAQSTKQKKTKEKIPQVSENTLLYKIEGNGIKTSYLYGTLHMLSKEDFHLSEEVLAAFKSSEQIVMELDMDNPGMQMEVMKHVEMKDGTTLDQLLNAADYKKLDNALQASYGAGVQFFNKWKPFMTSALLIKDFIKGEMASYEGTFSEMAKEQNKEILGLETPEEQLSVFDRISYEAQAKDLAEMLNDKQKTTESYARMIDLYKKHDLDGLLAFMTEYYKDSEQMELMLDSRNIQWIPKITEFSKEKSSFYAVGAGHLPGEMGVINLLRKEGFRVTAVR